MCSTIRSKWNTFTSRCYILCCTKTFLPVNNIFLEYKSRSLPAIHILLSKKTGTLYNRVVEKNKELLPSGVTGIITDYERAL